MKHQKHVTCSCGAILTELHRDVCPVYEDLTTSEISHESPEVLVARKQQAEADKLEADAKKAAKQAARIRTAASYRRNPPSKVSINPMAAAFINQR